ncbi:hypothetical protein DFA_00457 [Cavenderia fasciculata]|uniref:Transmembrane protein n=1 Tax=Cavenderia fasciculata TaxID=261658 RepID=F4PRZ8_CACFS|nr:uncharacterized protein DFA_00457 [Cavenderia fasciculata]EGG20596.1 hypothetical protein DFA_00457 [Cavenderia fasciculata]|eukprot:XP_004358446.1 hypothetical protein DFA_00457 [Cavenderia fasciculata]
MKYIKSSIKRNKFRLWLKSKSPFPWIIIFSLIANVPILLSMLILVPMRWSNQCSYLSGFLVLYMGVFAINLLYSFYFHKTMKQKRPRSCITVAEDCGLSSFFLFTSLSIILFIICEFLRRGTEFSQCYQTNSGIYHLLRGAQGMDIFFLVGFHIISFLNVCCSCYKAKGAMKRALPFSSVVEPSVKKPSSEYEDSYDNPIRK